VLGVVVVGGIDDGVKDARLLAMILWHCYCQREDTSVRTTALSLQGWSEPRFSLFVISPALSSKLCASRRYLCSSENPPLFDEASPWNLSKTRQTNYTSP
jgi:hypothetical protein